MHVAICDDNIAERKQMERLLGRLSDKIAAQSEPLYIDSFGNPEAMLAAQLHYPVYFIDLVHSQLDGQPINGYEMGKKLLDSGIETTICLCCGEIDYRQSGLLPHMFCIDKPISPSALEEAVANAAKENADRTPTITLRSVTNGTSYVKMKDIVYFRMDKDGHTVLHLTDGSTMVSADNICNLFLYLSPKYPNLYALSTKLMINSEHLRKAAIMSISFDTGETIKSGIPAARYAYNALRGHGRRYKFPV